MSGQEALRSSLKPTLVIEMRKWTTCIRCIAAPKLYSAQQLIVLILSAICIAVDVWAIFRPVAAFSRVFGLRGSLDLAIALQATEAFLGLAIIVLLSFVFSKSPDHPILE
jgi:hypothetical protein